MTNEWAVARLRDEVEQLRSFHLSEDKRLCRIIEKLREEVKRLTEVANGALRGASVALGKASGAETKEAAAWAMVERLKGYQAVHEAELGVCEEHCEVVQQLRTHAEKLEEALQVALHELTTLHNLTASDGLEAYAEALREGCDLNAAWRVFVAGTWALDTSKVCAKLHEALPPQTKDEEG